jgi:hypothetical protein
VENFWELKIGVGSAGRQMAKWSVVHHGRQKESKACATVNVEDIDRGSSRVFAVTKSQHGEIQQCSE